VSLIAALNYLLKISCCNCRMTRLPRPPRSKPLLRDDAGPLQGGKIRKRNPAQPQLPFDLKPEKVDLALAALKQKPPVTGEWSWEVKWDGNRLMAFIGPEGVRLVTRGGFDWAHRFPDIVDAAKGLGPATMILDGEAVVLDEQGRSDFGALQRSLGGDGRRSGNLSSSAILYALDLLYFDGHDLRRLDYAERRHLLEDTLQGLDGAIRVSEALDADPAELLQSACQLGLEGIVGKDANKPYRGGRTGVAQRKAGTGESRLSCEGGTPSSGRRPTGHADPASYHRQRRKFPSHRFNAIGHPAPYRPGALEPA
jgi:bifunctional non-homologous end joining protein LigD